jgi:hypothetical protein
MKTFGPNLFTRISALLAAFCFLAGTTMAAPFGTCECPGCSFGPPAQVEAPPPSCCASHDAPAANPDAVTVGDCGCCANTNDSTVPLESPTAHSGTSAQALLATATGANAIPPTAMGTPNTDFLLAPAPRPPPLRPHLLLCVSLT